MPRTAGQGKGSLEILETLQAEPGYKRGETTKDMKFTIRCRRIGACSIAPVIVIDGKYYGGLTSKSIYKLISTYKKKD
ncbi:MAG: NAD(P)H-dependent oxidoreductase subunit E [Candidatus Marinimicrobia bacterium]|nr:NAD(P)H-dependent oxidoreductase subunit E [Candidatus Neomarinimicrobiota bacterium]